MNQIEQVHFGVTSIICGNVTGSGFFYCKDEAAGKHYYVVTCKHVLSQAQQFPFSCTMFLDGNVSVPQRVSFNPSPILLSPTFDLALVDITASLAGFQTRNPVFAYFSKKNFRDILFFESIKPEKEVYLLGYPAGFYDVNNQYPLLRKTIFSVPYNLTFKPQNMPDIGPDAGCVDCEIVRGYSGCPVFLFTKDEEIKEITSITEISPNCILAGVAFRSGRYLDPVQELSSFQCGPNLGVNILAQVKPSDTLANFQLSNFGYFFKPNEILKLVGDV